MCTQEELQLILDEAVVARYTKLETKLRANNDPRAPCADRRDPFWRQKHFRREGVHYYSSVSLFRAGESVAVGGTGAREVAGKEAEIRKQVLVQRCGRRTARVALEVTEQT